MRNASGFKQITVAMLAILVLQGLARGQVNSPVPAGVDPKADAVLRQMGQTLAAAKAISFEANDLIDQTTEFGQKLQFSKTVKATVVRPDRIHAAATGDNEELEYFYRGTQMAIWNKLQHMYSLQDVPNNIDAMFDYLAERFGITAPLSDLMFSDPYQALIGRVRSGQYVGLHQVNGVKCHHLAFRQDGVDWQIWIEDGARAVPRKMVITYKELPDHPQFIAFLDKWDLSAKVSDDAFVFTAPADAKRVDLQPVNDRAAATQPTSESGK